MKCCTQELTSIDFIMCFNLIVAHCYPYIYVSDSFFDFVYIISTVVIYLCTVVETLV